jgi:disulfide bond formation protein DsbB
MKKMNVDKYIWLLIISATAVIATALASEIFGGLVPCALCLQQRWPYYIAIPILTVCGLARGSAPASSAPLLALVGLIFLVGAGLAAYHAGVEYKWWAGPSGCGGGTSLADNTRALLQALQNEKVVRCDEAAFTLFGLSMAGYNFLASLALAALSGLGYLAARNNGN